jgi:23S rRNA (cytosine1962-C5)-methyltransferase
MDQRRAIVVDALRALLSPVAIVERGDTPAREHEGLPQIKQVIFGELPESLIVDLDGLQMRVNPMEGQKTGLYLDQVENWRLARQFAPGRRVLDLFCNVGGFGLNAAKAGADSVRLIDSSELALSEAVLNASLNDLTAKVRAKASDAFQYVRSLPEQFDLIICDPPPFARSRKQLETALRGYREVNRQCLKLLSPGGILISCSCSAAVSQADFDKMLAISARDAGKMVRLLPGGVQPLDHAPVLSMPETQYLKTRVVQVM